MNILVLILSYPMIYLYIPFYPKRPGTRLRPNLSAEPQWQNLHLGTRYQNLEKPRKNDYYADFKMLLRESFGNLLAGLLIDVSSSPHVYIYNLQHMHIPTLPALVNLLHVCEHRTYILVWETCSISRLRESSGRSFRPI